MKERVYYKNIREDMLPLVPGSVQSVLEVGCAEGGFGAALKKARNCYVVGIEPDEKSAQVAAQALDQVISTEFPSNSLLDSLDRFDCVIFNDVLEHLINPWEAVNFTKKLLKPEGYIVASLPNMRHYPVLADLILRGEFEYRDKGVLDSTHLRFFTKAGMHKLFLNANFSLVTERPLNPTWLPRPIRLLNWLTRGSLEDLRYMQFGFTWQMR